MGYSEVEQVSDVYLVCPRFRLSAEGLGLRYHFSNLFEAEMMLVIDRFCPTSPLLTAKDGQGSHLHSSN